METNFNLTNHGYTRFNTNLTNTDDPYSKSRYTTLEVNQLFRDLFQEIKHGEQEHQDWLEDKIKDFVSRQVR